VLCWVSGAISRFVWGYFRCIHSVFLGVIFSCFFSRRSVLWYHFDWPTVLAGQCILIAGAIQAT